MMTKFDIAAEVLWDWRHIDGCKFYPGDKAKVNLDKIFGKYNISNPLLDHDGQVGTIVAVTCAPDGKIRGTTGTFFNGSVKIRRQFTRYYVEFEDGYCGGYHSHYLEKIDE